MLPEDILNTPYPLVKGNCIDIITYNLYSGAWWKGKKALLIKTQWNISGDRIQKGSQVLILKPMQYKRFGQFIHHGAFAIIDGNKTEIWGVDCYDLILI